MASSGTPPDGSDGLRGSVLSGGPRAEGRSDLGPAALFWEPEPGDPSVGTGIGFALHGGIPGAADPADRPRVEEGDYVAVRCTPILVAYPHRGLSSGGSGSAYYTVLGGRARLSLDGTVSPANGGSFRPEPHLVFTLGVELPGPVAERLGHAAAATSVFRGAPGDCRRPRLLSLVGSRPRLALSQLGHRLLSWKEFPSCAEH